MKTSVIIPVYNAACTIDDCLESLISQNQIPDEIVLIDNNSSDNSIDKMNAFIAKHPDKNIILLQESKKGAASARNKGLRHTSADIIAFTDSDCIVEKDWLKNIIAKFEKGDVDAVGGMPRIYQPKSYAEILQALSWNFPDTFMGIPVENVWDPLFGKMLGTLNCAVRKEVFEKIGLFDESLSVSGEDLDLSIRIKKAGFKMIVWIENIVVHHMPRRKYSQYLKQIFEYRNILPFLLKKHFKRTLLIDLSKGRYKRFPFFLNLALSNKVIEILLFLLVIFFIKITLPAVLLVVLLVYISVAKWIISGQGFLRQKFSFSGVLKMSTLEIVKKIVSECGRVYGVFKHRSLYL